MEQDELLREQLQYYRERAGEYDEWFLRQGRYDRGPDHREAWFGEVAVVEAALEQSLPSGGDVLELACGTGWWTSRLAARHQRVMAVDASPEVIAINRERVKSDRVDYVVADLFNWVPSAGAFDAVFFGFWLSHVPSAKFDEFWSTVRTALKPEVAGYSSSTVCSSRPPGLVITSQSIIRVWPAGRSMTAGNSES